MKKTYTAIGLMSGTSIDGIDAAVIETDGVGFVKPITHVVMPYQDDMRKSIKDLIAGSGDEKQVEEKLTKLHAKSVLEVLQKAAIRPDEIDVVGFHGQTIGHFPHLGITKQIGDGKLLASLCQIDVVNDFRSNDVKSGGQGAPLVPIYHQAIVSKELLPAVVVNIGGVANVTYLGENKDMLSFDCGTGNAFIDDYVLKKTGKRFDEGGKIAKTGKVISRKVDEFFAQEFFNKKPPKSLDRDEFKIAFDQEDKFEDVVATLTEVTAEGIVSAGKWFENEPKIYYIAGGGRHNKTIMKLLAEKLSAKIEKFDVLGHDGDAIEAEAFAYMAVRHLLNLPITFPKTTGAGQDLTGGVFCPA